MTLKTYRAGTMAEALAQVKQDLGPEAVILHTRTFRTGGMLGIAGKQIVEITASDDGGRVEPRKTRSRPRQLTAGNAEAGPAEEQGGFIPGFPVVAERLKGEPVEVESPPESVAPPAEPVYLQGPEPTPEPAPPTPVERQSPVEQIPIATSRRPDGLNDELASLRLMMGQVLQATRRTSGVASAPAMPEALFDCYLALTEARVPDDVVEALCAAVRDELAPGELDDRDVVRQTVLRQIARRVRTVEEPPIPQSSGRAATLALVGPTGVGKTTTLAKLAALFKLRHAKRVGLITADTYRIAAVDQLRTYADIIGVPLKTAMSPDEASRAMEELSDRDVVLVDTAGRSPNDAGRLEELRAVIRAVRPDRTHLVVSAAAEERAMLRTLERFAALEPDRLIFTKLDETVTFGPLMTLASDRSTPVSFLTTGQEVPDDIERPSADRLARLILDGSLRS